RLVDHCLMRPRFLINIIEYAVANAINRGHESVGAEDCTDAVRQHSNYLLNEFGYEIRDVSGLSARLLTCGKIPVKEARTQLRGLRSGRRSWQRWGAPRLRRRIRAPRLRRQS
ncbi:hypothetical protein, partial [Bradyrhizobium brasilense]